MSASKAIREKVSTAAPSAAPKVSGQQPANGAKIAPARKE